MRFADELVPLLGLLPDREERDRRPRQPDDLLREDGAHVRELHQVLGSGIRVGAGVDQDGRAAERRNGDGDGRTVDVGQPADLEEARGEHRARVAGADHRVGRPLVHGPAGQEERALPLLPYGVRGLLVHGHDLLGRDDLEAAGERLEHLGATEEDRRDLVRGSGERPDDDFLRRPIAAHGVDGDPDGLHLRGGRAERLDLAAPVGAAGRTDMVRPLRLMALRALDERRDRHLVRRPPLVAARLGGLSLRNGHRGG